MTTRTYRYEDIEAARHQWDAGKFSPEWDAYRRLAANSGIIYPPDGSRWDNWEDDNPSQRAILIRAIRETPELLRSSIVGARSWGEVIKRLLRGRDEIREDATLRERDDEWRRQDEIKPREALQSVHAILARISDSDPRAHWPVDHENGE